MTDIRGEEDRADRAVTDPSDRPLRNLGQPDDQAAPTAS
jgi:hypothetical protein